MCGLLLSVRCPIRRRLKRKYTDTKNENQNHHQYCHCVIIIMFLDSISINDVALFKKIFSLPCAAIQSLLIVVFLLARKATRAYGNRTHNVGFEDRSFAIKLTP